MRKYEEIYFKDTEGFEASEDDVLIKYAVKKAVTRAIDECIDEDVLKDFFVKYRKEVIEVGVLEYSAERHIQVIKDESYSMGCEDKEKELKPVIDTLTSENEELTTEVTRLRELLKKSGIDA